MCGLRKIATTATMMTMAIMPTKGTRECRSIQGSSAIVAFPALRLFKSIEDYSERECLLAYEFMPGFGKTLQMRAHLLGVETHGQVEQEGIIVHHNKAVL